MSAMAAGWKGRGGCKENGAKETPSGPDGWKGDVRKVRDCQSRRRGAGRNGEPSQEKRFRRKFRGDSVEEGQ